MKRTSISSAIALALVGTIARQSHAQSADEIVRLALQRSPKVAEAQHLVSAAKFRAKTALVSPVLEVAPGIGFTNSNFVLSQSVDVFGRLSTQRKVAEATVNVAEAKLTHSQAEVATEALEALAELRLAIELNEAQTAYSKTARELFDSVTKQVETGEAPQVQSLRAEIELSRAEQSEEDSKRNVELKLARLQALTGSAVVPVGDELRITEAEPAKPYSVRIAVAERMVAQESLKNIAKSFGPEASVGVSTDVWSLDRKGTGCDSWGIQAVIRIPIGDLGVRRNAEAAQRSEISATEAAQEFAQLRANLEIDQARRELETAQLLESRIVSGLLEKSERVVQTVTVGYQTGASTLLEVLEARQTRHRIQVDLAQARYRRRLAEVRYLAATANLPGIEVPK